jgi:hypothetical protein
MLAPDRPPTAIYETYPKVYTPPFHFGNPSQSKAVVHAGTAVPAPPDRQIAAAARQAQRALDCNEIENLQNAYGYYVEKSLWSDISMLFAEDAVLELDAANYAGRDRIRAFLESTGPEGPVQGVLNSQLQLQPVIHIDTDGSSARLRSRVLELTRDAQGRPMWGGGIYENEVVKVQGVWKFRRLHLYRNYKVFYKGGWAAPGKPASDEGQILPSQYTVPFHYRNPVSGK